MQRSAQAAVDPQTKPPDLGCESACRRLSSTTTITNKFRQAGVASAMDTVPMTFQQWLICSLQLISHCLKE